MYDYGTRRTCRVQAGDLHVLSALDEWQTAADVGTRVGRSRASVKRALDRLERLRLIETSDRPRRRSRAMERWADWSPAAAFYHFSTKDVRYAGAKATQSWLSLRQAIDPAPPPVKTVHGPRRMLPPFKRAGAFPSVLLSRRSWRRFGRAHVTLAQLSTLLGLTWATQRWVHAGGSSLQLKTSPSGGALHSVEAYVAVASVRGLRPALYHYDPDAHALVRLPGRCTREWLARSLGGQRWFAGADAVVFMTSVFERVQWKYPFPRAYRVVLLEAGHFCQTFCLAATWLGLAPFCTAATADSAIERRLGIDGVGESVIYAAGVGTRPPGAVWAPWPDADALPRTTNPEHRQARRRRVRARQ
jgi:SagB-type dehydrogenase family enzyme